MNKLVFSNVGGYPFNEISINHMQDAWRKGFEALGKALTASGMDGLILSGCTIGTVGTTSTAAAGLLFIGDEIYVVDGNGSTNAVAGLYWHLTTAYLAGDPVTFKDATTHNVHQVRKAVLFRGTAPFGDPTYIAVGGVPRIDQSLRLLLNPPNGNFVPISSFSNNWTSNEAIKYIKERTINGLWDKITIIGSTHRTGGTPAFDELMCDAFPAPAADVMFQLPGSHDANGIAIKTDGKMYYQGNAVPSASFMSFNGQVSYFVAV